MPTYSSSDESSIDFLELRIHKTEAREAFDRVCWKSLKAQLASTAAIDLAGVSAKLRVVLDGIQVDTDQPHLDLLRSAITDLRLLSPDC